MDYKILFLQFLTKNKVISNVYDNCDRPIMDELNDEEPADYLLSLFLFHQTKEGLEFWLSIQDLWLNYLEEYEGVKE